MKSIEIKGISQDSDVNRFIKACAFEETDRVPSHEQYVMKNTIRSIFGEKRIKEILFSEETRRVLYLLTDAESEEEFTITNDKIWQMWKHNLMEWYSFTLPPSDHLELLKATGTDIATPPLTWLPKVHKVIGTKGTAYSQNGLKEEDLKLLDTPVKKVEKMFELIDWYIDEFKGTGVGVGPICRASFCNAYEVIGMEKFLISINRDIELIEHVLDIFNDYAVKIAEGLSKRNIDCFWIDDDLCMNRGFFVNPQFIKDYWVPRAEAILKPIKEKGIPIFMHCCGNLKDLLPIIIDMGITGIQPVQPNCNDIYSLNEEYGGKITFIGNMDLAGVLGFGTPKEVVEDTKKHIDRLGPNGGYVVCSSHSITDSVPFENYVAMIKTAQTHTD